LKRYFNQRFLKTLCYNHKARPIWTWNRVCFCVM